MAAMLSLYKLQIFVAVVKAGSFSQAGERLYLTQSAVSQHIQDLEAHMATELFKRGRRGVDLTPAGEILLDYANNILRLAKEAESAVTNVDLLQSGHLRIGSTPGIDVYLLPDWVGTFQHRFPNLRVSMTTDTTSQIIDDLLNHTLDIGLVEGELDCDDQICRLELEHVDQLVIVGRQHPWYSRKTLPIEALADQLFVTRPSNSHTRLWLEHLLKQHEITLKVVAEFDNPEAIKRAVSAGMGISILPEYVVEHELALGNVRALRVHDVTLQRSLKLVWDRREPFSPIARAFLVHLAGEFPQLLAQEDEILRLSP